MNTFFTQTHTIIFVYHDFFKMKTLTKNKELSLHLGYWVIFLFNSFIISGYNTNTYFSFKPVSIYTISFVAITITTFYLNYFFILKYVFKKNVLIRLICCYLGLFVFFATSRYLIEEKFIAYFTGYGNYNPITPLAYYLLDNFYWFSTPAVVSIMLWVIVQHIQSLERTAILLSEKKQAEIQFLKAQINPHFIFNTLNNIYALVVTKSEKALPALERLSELLRFTTYETEKDFIEISMEIQYIESYVELENLRNKCLINVDFKKEIANANQLVPPYLIFPFFENAIKHAVLNDFENPIQIYLKLDSNELLLTSSNKCNRKQKDGQGGLGLENLKMRLEYYYPNQYTFEIIEEGQFFKCHLQIQL